MAHFKRPPGPCKCWKQSACHCPRLDCLGKQVHRYYTIMTYMVAWDAWNKLLWVRFWFSHCWTSGYDLIVADDATWLILENHLVLNIGVTYLKRTKSPGSFIWYLSHPFSINLCTCMHIYILYTHICIDVCVCLIYIYLLILMDIPVFKGIKFLLVIVMHSYKADSKFIQ